MKRLLKLLKRFLPIYGDPHLINIDNQHTKILEMEDGNEKYLLLSDCYKQYANYWSMAFIEPIIEKLTQDELLLYNGKVNLYLNLSKANLDKVV